ncbi:hypothetical protein G6F65_019985 [Rhizopus arrhizus]|nr:hypothetical protein G6F65_019985 [Rhizopus arrhizus]
MVAGGEPVATAVRLARAAGQRARGAAAAPDRTGTADLGDHRDHCDEGRRCQPGDPQRSDRDGRAHRHRRFRHRLFQPAVPQAHAGHRTEDRPRLRARPGMQ